MKKQNQRQFITASPGTGLASAASTVQNNTTEPPVVHHVFFWLKNKDSKEDLNRLLQGLKTLEKIETVRKIHIGVPASTELREVVDASFSASELLFFDDLAGQKIYQDHALHQKFIADCSHLWEKVIVYDAIEV